MTFIEGRLTSASNLAAISLTLTLRATTSEAPSKATVEAMGEAAISAGASAGVRTADDSPAGEATLLVCPQDIGLSDERLVGERR